MTERKTSKAASGQAGSIEAFFSKWVKSLFVGALLVWLLYVSIFVGISAQKFVVLMAAPILVELALLGTGNYFVSWVRGASPLRTLVSSGFIAVLGLSVMLVNGGLLVGGIIVVFGVAFATSGVWKYHITHDLGIKSQDPVVTVSLAVFMTGVVAAFLGGSSLSALLLSCSLLLYFYASHIFDVILTILTVVAVYSLVGSAIYVILVLSVGVGSVLLGLYVKERAFIAGIVSRTSSLRLLLSGVYSLLIGVSLILLSLGEIGFGLAVVAFIFGVILTVYSGIRISADGDLRIKGEDPVKTVSLVILLTGLLIMLGGFFGLFVIFLTGFLILVVYDKLYPSVLLTVFTTLVLFLVLGVVYAVVALCIGVVAVPLGIFTVRKRTRRLLQAAKKKK